jgi:hypothetical protein
LGDRRNVGESSCNSRDGTGQIAQTLDVHHDDDDDDDDIYDIRRLRVKDKAQTASYKDPVRTAL